MTSKPETTPAMEAAFALIARLIEVAPAYRAANDQAQALQGDFAGQRTAIDECVYGQVIALLDATLGNDEIATYFLHECQSMKDGGSVLEADGREWPLRTLDDLRAYVMREPANV